MKKTPPLKTPDTHGRIGVVGLRSAGKTGVFVGIAANRAAQRHNRTVTLMPLDSPSHPDLERGRQWIQACLKVLLEGALPEANEIDVPRLALHCQFTEGPYKHLVEGMDYSGELLNPNASATETAILLRNYFKDVSGLIVLLEAPVLGQPPQQLTKAQTMLMEALSIIGKDKGKEHLTPMVLAVAKWDRQWPQQGDEDFDPEFYPDDESEDARLRSFMAQNPPPPHVEVLKVLDAASGGNAACFPISALGRCARHHDAASGGVTERPVELNPLQSYGIERPFIFIANRRNQLDLQWLQKHSTWRNLLPNFGRTDAVRRIADLTLARMPKNSVDRPAMEGLPNYAEDRLAVNGLRRRIRHVRIVQNTSLVCALLLLLLSIEASFDHIGHNRAEGLLTDSTITTEEARLPGEHWLATYRDDRPWKHLLYSALGTVTKGGTGLTRAQAEARRMQAIQEREDRAYNAMMLIKDRESQKKAAHEFLRVYASSKRADEVKALTKEIQRQIDIADCLVRLVGFREQLTQLHSTSESHAKAGHVAGFKGLYIQVDSIRDNSRQQVAEHLATLADEGLASAHDAFTEHLGKTQKIILDNEARAVVRQHFNEQWSASKFVAALISIADERGEARDPIYDDLRSRFATSWQAALEDRLRVATGSGSGWRAAQAEKEELLAQIPLLAGVTARTPADLSKVFDAMGRQIHERGMRFEYESLGRTRVERARLARYLKEFPDTPHLQVLQEHLKWLDIFSQEQQMRFTIKYIKWQGIPGSHIFPVLSATVDGQKWLESFRLPHWPIAFSWSHNYASSQNQPVPYSFPCKVVPAESLALTISLNGHGSGECPTPPADWMRQREEPEHPDEAPQEVIFGSDVVGSQIVTLNQGTKFYLVAEISLDGKWVPLAKPPLPAWE